MKYFYLIWKNLMRKKLRTTLTVLSIVVAFLLFGVLGSIRAAFSQGVDIAGADRLLTMSRVSLMQSLPYSYVQRVRDLDGVEHVGHSNWFGAHYQEPHNQFPQFAVDAESYLSIYADAISLSPEHRYGWMSNRIGAVVGNELAERFNWEVGDRIPLISIFPRIGGDQTWEFVIEGIYESQSGLVDSGGMLFHYTYFDEAREWDKGTVGWLVIKVIDPELAGRVAEEVDLMFANSINETRTSTEKAFIESFLRQFGDIGTITTLILGAVFFTMLLVAANTMSQAVRERISEMAILKTLGFSDRAVVFMILAESLLMVMIGGGLGMLLANVMTQGAAVDVQGALPGFRMSGSVWGHSILAMVVLGLMAGILPAAQGMRLNIVTALGRR